MNIELLRRIQKHITEEPKRLVMGSFIQRQTGEGDTVCDPATGYNHAYYPFAQCGTAACIAGWACLLTEGMNAAVGPTKAQELLDLEGDWLNSDGPVTRLFEPASWPTSYREEYRQAVTPTERAAIAVARIDHFISTNGEE